MSKSFDELTMKDEFVFVRVMEKHDNLQEFLQRLLPDRTIGKITIQNEKSLKPSWGAKGVRLDILATDDKDVYDVEMNTGYDIKDLRRGRYYASSLDTEISKKGEQHKDLPDVTIVFIIKNDLFHDNICMHTGIMHFTPEGNPEKDYGVMMIYLNIEAEEMNAPEELAEVLKYMTDGTITDDIYLKNLEQDVQEVKQDPAERRAYMELEERLALERQMGRDEGTKAERINGIVNMYEGFIESGISKTDTISKVSVKYDLPEETIIEIIENRQQTPVSE